MFIQKRFNNDSNPTMGVEFATKKIHVAGKLIKLQVWDTVNIDFKSGWAVVLSDNHQSIL
jgi:GTPase SAR1 family protein